MNRLIAQVRRRQTSISVTVLALLAYLPALTAAPGRMPADSKLYVYLDPGRFIADTTTTFDARQFAGWVPHQHIAYLWPTGPWYWMFETLGFPDWIAHRLWLGTLLLLGGLGVRWMARVLGFAPLAALAAALVYQLSPYILPYISRTSVLLLPFAGLGWIVALTIAAGRRGGWRHPAAIALVVLTVGAVNATALAMIIPAPVLWLVHAVWQRSITWRRAAATAGKVALLSTGVSLWWIAMLLIQGRHGADVLAYSESLESVSFTSTSTEVTRGLGYWLFYIRDAFGATTTASLDYLASGRVVLTGFVLTAVCLAGIVFVRSVHRRFAALLFGVGVVLAVGVHPIDDPSPLMAALVGDRESGLALALRSSTRAVPVMLLGLSLGAASLVSVGGEVQARLRRRVGAHTPRPSAVIARVAMAAGIGVLAVANLPALRTGGFVDPALERDQTTPEHWLEAAAALDGLPDGYRILQVPGTEFGAFGWGFTVDQPLPGLTDRPIVTRDLLPLGSAPAMDLVFALDDRFQNGTVDTDAVAAVSRLLGVDTIWVSGDVSFERFRLARPEVVTAELTSPDAVDAGLVDATPYGLPTVMTPPTAWIDEESLGDERVGKPIAPITLVSVADPVPTVRVKDDVVLLSGSGDGVIDAAAAGLVDGTEAIVYTATVDPGDPGVDSANRLIVTDSNRDRAHHWRSSQDVTGFTESGGPGADVLVFQPGHQRLPVFPDAGVEADSGSDSESASVAAEQTVSIQRGPVIARASAYGEPFAYLPEHRPVMAIDGDPTTSWTVADRAPAVGEFIELKVSEPIGHLDLLQPPLRPGQRSISGVVVTVDDREPIVVGIDDSSLVGDGQRIEFEPTDGPSTVTITIAGTTDPQPPIGDALAGVGFAEIDTGLAPTVEWIRPPLDGLEEFASATAVDLVMTRLRTEPTDRWRDDPEPVLRREIELPRPMVADADVTLRLDQRAPGAMLATLLGESAVDDAHLTGAPTTRAAAAFDDDPTTAWVTPFATPRGSAVALAGAGLASTLTVEQPDGDYSPITVVRIDDGGGAFDIAVDEGELALPRAIDLTDVRIEIVDVAEAVTLDRRFTEPFVLPVAISELRFDGAVPAVENVERLSADCRTDVLEIDGEPVGISFDVAVADALAGAAIDATVCDPTIEIDAGPLRIESTDPGLTGYHVDQVTLSESGVSVPSGVSAETDGGGVPTETPDSAETLDSGVDPTETVLVESSRRSRTVEVPACPRGCWLVLGEGFNDAWSARSDDGDLGEPRLIDGNANGWWIESSETSTRVEITWTAQGPLNIAYVLSAFSVLAAIALIVADRRRRRADAEGKAPELTLVGLPATPADRGVIVGGLAVAGAAALFIGPLWGLGAAVIWSLAALVRRVELVTWMGWAIVFGAGLIVTSVVVTDGPFPNAGWPVRFEWLHGWTLLGVVMISVAASFARPGAEQGADPARPSERIDG